MPLILFVSFIVVPLVELAVISRVGAVIGFWPTIILLVVDSLVGAVLVRQEGRRAWSSFRRALDEGRWPGDEVVQGALVLIGGALLLTPGFVTDVVGLLAVLPPTRSLVSRAIRRRLSDRMMAGDQRPPPPGTTRDRRVLDVEVLSIEPDDDPPTSETAGGS